jgi:D-3-phosphoglycerate dehydrogenase / 2-oxoglutarate reductase
VRSVLVTDYAWPNLDVERELLARAGCEVVAAETGSEDELVALATNADAILTNWKPVTTKVLENAPRCLTVVRYGVGLDNIDVGAATRLGMIVSNVPDYCIEEVSDHTMALLLALARRVVAFAGQTRAGGWDNQEFGEMHRLRGRTLGLVGFGRIARRVAPKARAFGLDVVAWSPNLATSAAEGTEVASSLDELLGRADIVSLHAPLTSDTQHLIGPDQFTLMRPGALLINTARGALVDQHALLDALGSGQLGGAGIDVLDEEPPPADHPLRQAARVVLTPHAAFYSVESVRELQEKAAANVVLALAGDVPATIVNPEVLESPTRRRPATKEK